MRGGLVTPKIPARVIHTSIRVPVTAEEYATIKRAAKLRGAPSLAAWLRERGASFGLADGLEALAVREEALDALRRLLETQAACDTAKGRYDDALAVGDGTTSRDGVFATWREYVAARDAHEAARAVAKEVAK